MNKLRSINTSIWGDTWFEELTPTQKLLFIYFITNERTNMLGVYEISVKKISFETGIGSAEIEKHLKKFEAEKKIRYSENRVILLNYLKHQKFNPNMKVSAVNSYNELPESLKIKGHSYLDVDNEGFEILCQGFGMVRKIEVESKGEDESKGEPKIPPVFNFKSSLLSLGVEEQVASDWLKVRQKLSASNTETAFKVIKTEIEKTNHSANECITEAVARSWRGFKAEWMKKTDQHGNQHSNGENVVLSTPKRPELT